MGKRSSVVWLLALVATAAIAQAPSAAPTSSDIEVKGRSREELRAMVGSLTDSGGNEQLTRWNAPICPATYGLPEAYGRFIIRRIQSIAAENAIPLDHGNCTPNIVILSMPDADRYMARFVARHRALGRNWGQGLPPRSQVDALLQSRAVRWFHASTTNAADSPTDVNAPVIEHASTMASRLRLATREDARLAVIVLDPDRIAGATWDELADYVAMIGLARPQLGANFDNAPSIMSLYSTRGLAAAPPAGLTREDRAFLEALYTSDPRKSGMLQREMITGRIPR